MFYELKKFVGLLLNCNPNVLSLLWLKPSGIIYENAWGGKFIPTLPGSLRAFDTPRGTRSRAGGEALRGDEFGVSPAMMDQQVFANISQ